MKIAQWLNTARIMGILYALFVFSLGYMLITQTDNVKDNWELFTTGTWMAMWQLVQCVFVGIMIEAWRQHRTSGTISRRIAKMMYWIPRIVWMLITLFFAVIGASFFGDGSFQIENIWAELPTLALFLAPFIIMGIILVAAWRWEAVGAAVIIMVIIFFLIQFSYYSITIIIEQLLLFIVPLLIFAAAFWLNSCWHKEIQAALRGEPFPLEQPAGS